MCVLHIFVWPPKTIENINPRDHQRSSKKRSSKWINRSELKEFEKDDVWLWCFLVWGSRFFHLRHHPRRESEGHAGGVEWPRVPAWTHLYFWQLGARFHLSVAFFICSGRFFFGRNVFDVVWGFWCIAQFVDAIGWRVLPSQCLSMSSAGRSEWPSDGSGMRPARGVIPEVKLNEIGTHPLRALSGRWRRWVESSKWILEKQFFANRMEMVMRAQVL